MPRTDPPVAPPFVQGQRGETGWADWVHAQVEAQWAEKVAIADIADPASAARVAGDGVWALNTGTITAKSRGAVTDGTTDDTAALVQAIADCPVGGVVLLPPGNTRITSPLSITKSMTLVGSGAFTSRIYADACGGIVVAAGVTDFHMEAIEVAAAIRYTTTTNTYVGIQVLGATGSRPAGHVYRDVYVDGFQTAFQSGYLWSSNFDNFRCSFGLIGLDIYGLSVNNVVSDSQIGVTIAANSRGIRFAGAESATDATAVASEGWIVHDSLIYGGEYGVDIIGVAHVDVHDCIIDMAQLYGVRIRGNGANFGGNCNIHDNYIGMIGASGVAAIDSANTVSNAQNTRNLITGNRALAYSGATCGFGINVSGAYGLATIDSNILKGFATCDIYLQSSGCKVVNNECLSGMANAISGTNGQLHLIANNSGLVYLPGGGTSPFSYATIGKVKDAVGIAAPTVNTWIVGDYVRNALPAAGSPKGWFCTVAGTPGTWVDDSALATTDVQVFTSSGTWTMPAGAQTVEVIVVGAGGGGGSGRRGAANTVRCGGGGGPGGASARAVVQASLISSPVTVNVVTGSAGGAAITADDTDGAGGSVTSGRTSFGAYLGCGLVGGGAGGTNATGTGGAAGITGMFVGGGGASASTTGLVGPAASTVAAGGGGGGAGGGITSANATSAGGAGAMSVAYAAASTATGGTANGGNGTIGTAAPANSGLSGQGGGGGGSNITGAAGDGANGAIYGAGGGGGGASLNGYSSGKGGNGASGIVVVITRF